MDWIESIPSKALKQWISETRVPMLAFTPDGGILWCNAAFEDFLEYSIVELVGPRGKSWNDLTSSSEDAAADMILVRQVEAGARKDYMFQKSYRSKSGRDRKCQIHVLRYPATGDFECCLVSVIPLDAANDMLLQELQELRAHQVKILDHLITKPPSYFERYLAFSKERPVHSAIATLFAMAMLFGTQVLEIAQAIREVFFGGKP